MTLDYLGAYIYMLTLEGADMAKGKRKAAPDGMKRYSLFLRPDQVERMKAIQEEVGVTVTEQIRRAVDAALGIKRHGGQR